MFATCNKQYCQLSGFCRVNFLIFFVKILFDQQGRGRLLDFEKSVKTVNNLQSDVRLVKAIYI